MKKILILLLTIILILSGCQKKEENDCHEEKEKIKVVEYIDRSEDVITIGKEKKTALDIIDVYSKDNYRILFDNIKSELLKKELSKSIKEAEEYAEEYINYFKETYGDSLEYTIKSTTNYSTIEEFKEYILINYLEQEYINNYIEENKNTISQAPNIKEENIEEYYYYKFYIPAIKDLFNKYEVKFEDQTLKETHEKYLEDINKYYSEQINSLENK